MTISISLTKGYTAIVDDIDKDLAALNWTVNTSGMNVYAVRISNIGGKPTAVLMHRVILGRVLNRELIRKESVDHKNGNGLINTRSNLRLSSQSQNSTNSNKHKITDTSPYKGVFYLNDKFRTKPWRSDIRIEGKSRRLGLFSTAIEAHKAYAIAALTYAPEFANLGSNSPFTDWTLIDFKRGYKQLELPFLEAA